MITLHITAHALELDLIGGGHSWADALSELRGCIEAQVSYAMDVDGSIDTIWNRAPDKDYATFKATPARIRIDTVPGCFPYEIRIADVEPLRQTDDPTYLLVSGLQTFSHLFTAASASPEAHPHSPS